MSLAIVLIVASVLSLVVILGWAASRALQVPNDPELAGRIQPIDVQAFRNLIEPGEAQYLRRRLRAAEFRTVQRERLRAAIVYLKALNQNAAILARVGQAAMSSNNPAVVEAARQLVGDATLLRRNVVPAMFKIYFEMAWPSADPADDRVLRGYERLNGSAMLLGRLQNPEVPVRLSAS